jgi:hypothetical protein
MSWFRFAGAPRKATIRDGFLTRFFSRTWASSRKRESNRRNSFSRRSRALAIDPLESRCLLSVAPAELSAVIVNQTFGSAQSTNTAHSVAVDNSGDFVVTWTRSDLYTNAAGTTFPVTNVFARYYTDAVQQVNLPTSLLTTTGTKQPYFSLKYNDQTIEQISVKGEAQSPLGNPAGSPFPGFPGVLNTNIAGTFVLFYNATGNDTPGQMVPTVNGGTQSDLLTVNYNEIATFNAAGAEIAGPALAAEQIQNWLNAFAPEAANGPFAGSDATHATVNAIDPHTFVVDYGLATKGLDQSSLLQYVGTEATTTTQNLTFNSTAGATTAFYTGPGGPVPVPAVPFVTPITVFPENIALQVGTVQTAPFLFDISNPAATATAMQAALVNAGFAGATVAVAPGSFFLPNPETVNGVNISVQFTVTFATAEPPVQYVVPTTDGLAPQLSFSNSANVSSLSGFLPSVAISTLDKPFTVNNIPFSQTNPTLTAEAIAGAFQAQVDAFSTGVAPYAFVSLSPQTAFNVAGSVSVQVPYTAPIYNNVTSTADVPVTGWDPTLSVAPVVQVNPGGTNTTSFTQFTVTFTSVTGTIVDAPLVVTGITTANGATTPGGTTSLDGTVALPTNVAGATVTVLKQSGNEFQVNPTPAPSVYTANQPPLNASQPSVAMDGSGDFVVTWAGEVSQQLAPKDFTDIFARIYAPVGVTPAGTTVPDSVNSDLYQQQVLRFAFPAGSGTPTSGETFELQVGPFVTGPITWDTNTNATANNIQAALAANPAYADVMAINPSYIPVTVSAASSGNPYDFLVVFNTGGAAQSPIQYVTDPTTPLPSSLTYSTTPLQSFTGVRLVTNPTQTLTFDFTAGAPTATGNLGTFQLQIGSFSVAAINFNSNPTVTALNMQNALRAAGFAGVAVSAQGISSISPSFFTFNVNFSGYDVPPVQYVPISPALGGLPASVVMSNGGSGLPANVLAAGSSDPYTIQVNANYTNPQIQPAVAMDPYGNFVVVWANQGPDESYFNDISMQCFDNTGNPLGTSLVVDQDPSNPAVNYNTDTNFNPSVAIALNNLNLGVPTTDSIVVSYTTAVTLPALITQFPDGSVYVRGYSFNPEQKQGPAPLPWNQFQVAGNGGISSVSMDGQNNFYVAWQQVTDPDVNALTSEGIYGTEYQMINYTSGAALGFPNQLRPTFRINSSSDDTASQTFWPFSQEAAQIQTTISGDIVTSYQGYSPQVSDNISVPSSFFTSQFALEQQRLTFNFTGSPSPFTFELLVGSTLTDPIAFSTSATTTATNIQTALQTTLASLGFAGTPAAVTGTSTGGANPTYTFTVIFGIGPNEPLLAIAGALPSTVTFANSVSAPAAAQKLTFTPASVPATGVFQLQTGAQTTAPIYFDSTNPANTAANIQAALLNLGFTGTLVAVDGATTTTSFVFDVTFAAAQAPLQFVAASALPTNLAFSAAITTQWKNADLLAYFDPFTNGAANPIIGLNSQAGFPTPGYLDQLYELVLGSTRGNNTNQGNFTVTTAIDQVLFGAEYEPPLGTPAATQDQLSRLDAILQNVAGLLRGEGAGVMTSHWDANSIDSTDSTYSDNIASTQRQGEEQRYYLVIPYDVQQGTFHLSLGFSPPLENPNDVATFAGVTTRTTQAINMPSTAAAAPGGPINALTTAENIARAIDQILGFGNYTQFVGSNTNFVYGEGAVNVRTVPLSELSLRQGTTFQAPGNVYNYATTNPISATNAITPTQFLTRLNAQGNETRFPAAAYNSNNAVVFELTFEGQAHDVPISLALRAVPGDGDQQWVGTRVITAGTPPTSTTTYAEGGASPPVVLFGDYTANLGAPQYNAALAVTSAGNQVVTYTNQQLQTDQKTPVTDANGNLASNVYYSKFNESTDIAGPHLVGWTDGNGVDLLNTPKASAVGVNSKYMVLTFDEPMLADNPATDPDSIYNLANYQIYDSNGNLLSNVVAHVDYGLSEVSRVAGLYGFNNINSSSAIPDNKWEVVLTINDTATATGTLPNGTYTLKLLAAEHATTGGQTGLCNIYGTPLNLTGFNQPTSVPFQQTVTISSSTNPGGEPIPPGLQQQDTPINTTPYVGGQQFDPAVSSTNDSGGTALNGNYVVVWSSTVNGQTNIVGQMYKSSGVQIGGEFQVNTTASKSWNSPKVAMDASGDFVIVWSGQSTGSTSSDISDIYGRAYNANGQALTSQFLISQFVFGVQPAGMQFEPSVAMSPDGTYVVAWASTPNYTGLSNQNTFNTAIFAREYNQGDVPIGNEFQVTPSSSLASTFPSVAIDAHDNFVIIWEGDLQSSTTWGVYGDYFTVKGIGPAALPTSWTSSGGKLLNQMPNSRGSFNLSTNTGFHTTGPSVAMIPSGSTAPAGFVVAWPDYVSGNFSIFAQQFGPNGTANSTGALNTASTIMVNPPQSQTGAGWQYMPAVGVDPEGDIAVAWTTYGQDNANNGISGVLDYGIYMNIYYSSNSGKGLAGTNSGEFRVNATTLGNQVAPAIGFNDFENDALVAWVGPAPAATRATPGNAAATAIYDRDIDPPNTPPSVPVPVTPKISAANTTVAIGTSATKATFTVTLSTPSTKAVTVNYATSNGTATAGVNYTAASGSITFAPMQTTATIPVTVAGLAGGGVANTNFSLNLSTPGNATLSQATATATITNAAPTIVVAPLSQFYTLGQTITFTTSASGTPKPTVQWQISANGVNWINVTGATSTTYTVTPTAAMSGYSYRAVFTNIGGSVATAPATVTLHTAPTLMGNPISQAVNVGATVTFRASASGTPTPTVQWQASTNGTTWTNIPGATSTTYQVAAAANMTGRMYRAVFSNSLGTTTSNPATLTVHTPPVITTNPISQSAAAGSQVTFTAAASGTPAPTVQWQTSTNGNTWTNIAGATSSSYTVTATGALSGRMYQAMFTNSYGLYSITTPATLTVSSQPVVTTNPSSQSVVSGATATFTAAAAGSPTPTVQWQSSTDGTTWANIAGATSASYVFTATTAASGTQYRAVFTNSLGTATTTAATLSVNVAPVVTASPASQSVLAGASVKFTAAASGATSVQWQSSANGGVSFSNIAGATTTSYTVTASTAMSGYQYRALFTNAAGSVTTTAATLTVSIAPVVTANPVSKTVSAGATVVFTAAASGTPTPTVQWQSSSNGTTWTDIAGATSTSYSFTATIALSGSQYRAVFTSTAGTATTSPATLTVAVVPVVIGNPTSQSVISGTMVNLSAAATSATSTQWQLSTNGGSTWTNITGATSATYSFTADTTMSGNQYRALFSNTAGTATTSAATLTVGTPITITSNPQSAAVAAGTSVTLTTSAIGTPAPTVQWQVSSDNAATYTNIAGATTTSYTVTATVAISGYNYRAVFTSPFGVAATSPATVTIAAGPVITANPVSQAVVTGATANFTAAATSATSTQWQLSTNGGSTWTNITGATSATYSVTATASMTGYQYRATFTNAAGSATTSVAALTVGTPITITSNPQSASVAAGTSVTLTTSAIGTPAPTVQWQVSSDNAATYTNIAGATTTSYTVTAIAAISGYKYRAVFTSPFGVAATSPATLTISAGPAITASPVSQSAAVGATVNFSASATGATSTQWQLSTNGGSTWTNITGATSATYSVTAAAAMSGYQYRVLFTNAAGSATTSAATLTVGSLTITSNPQSKSVAAGTSVTFTTSAIGTPTPSVQWQVSSNNAVTWTNIAGATSTSYTVTATAAMSGYEYRAVFTNSLGAAATSPATLTVAAQQSVALPVVLANPVSQSVVVGQLATFSAAASGTPAPTVQWQASANGTTWTNIPGATTTSYTFATVATQSGYLFRAVFTNSVGLVTTTAAKLTVTAAAAAVVQASSLAAKTSLNAAAVDVVLVRL